MRNKHLVEQFMEENNLEYNVPFVVKYKKYDSEEESMVLKIRGDYDCNIEVTDEDDEPLVSTEETLGMLLFDENARIIKKPWKPKNGEAYYYVSGKGNVLISFFNPENYMIDLYNYILNNCFRTVEEAEKHKDEMLKILNGEPLVKWED